MFFTVWTDNVVIVHNLYLSDWVGYLVPVAVLIVNILVTMFADNFHKQLINASIFSSTYSSVHPGLP